MRIFLILITLIGVLLSLVWLVTAPAFESGVALIASIVALCTSFLMKRKNKVKEMVQHVSEASVGIQAGRDVNVRDIGNR